MKAEVSFSEAQCRKIATIIRESSFCMSGIGHFGLTDEEVAEVLFTCINSKNYKRMGKMLTAKYNLWLRLRGM